MGYHAPSAEEVYRYALRLDTHSRSLTDRFGFSIVFVNDTSAMCQAFLENYCVDLCFRTADRIRFVFFSELPETDFEVVADGINRGKSKGGMLRNILTLLGRRPSWNLDFEHEPWRSLRPRSLIPLRNLEEINRHLDWECDTRTAMPGANMAMQFAQRLGIGRHIPCILIFTDIGELHVDIMPVSRMSPQDVYSHIREWVDGFYERNQDLIQRWQNIEDEIEKLCSQTNSSLHEIRDWRNRVKEKWENLQIVSNTTRILESAKESEWHNIVKKSNYRLPYKIQTLFQDYLEEQKRIDTRRKILENIKLSIELMHNSNDYETVYKAFQTIKYKNLSQLINVCPKTVESALKKLEGRSQQLKGPYGELKSWLSHARRFSRKRHRKFRKYWKHLVGEKILSINEEFEVILAALTQLPLSVDPECGAEKVISALRNLYSIDHDAETWHLSTSGLHGQIKQYIREVITTVPEWLRNKDLKINIPIDLPRANDPVNINKFLSNNPKIKDALDETERCQETNYAKIRKNWEEIAQHQKNLVISDLQALALHHDIEEDERMMAQSNTLAQLRQWRRRLESEVYDEQDKIQNAKSPFIPINRKLMQEFEKTLAQYDNVVDEIFYPHLEDPLVMKVPLTTSVTLATGLDKKPRPENAMQRLRNNINKVENSEEEGKKLWPEIQREVMDWNPAAKLCMALEIALPKQRIDQILSNHPGENILARVASILNTHQTLECLEKLNVAEMDALVSAIGNRDNAQFSNTFQEKAEFILGSIGMFIGKAGSSENEIQNVLNKKITTDEFDVFMAHNSSDKEAVVNISGFLKTKGIYSWIDIEQIPPGQWFQDVIQMVIPKVKAAAIFLGEKGIGRWQVLELRAFISQCVECKIPVIPVLLPGVSSIPKDMLFLRELNYVQFQKRVDEKAALMQLIWGITGKKPFQGFS